MPYRLIKIDHWKGETGRILENYDFNVSVVPSWCKKSSVLDMQIETFGGGISWWQ